MGGHATVVKRPGRSAMVRAKREASAMGSPDDLAAALGLGRKAVALCKRQKARLVVAKLDRLSRNLLFLATMFESGVDFKCVDMPSANRTMLGIMAVIALLGMPFVLSYTIVVYWVFRGKVRLGKFSY